MAVYKYPEGLQSSRIKTRFLTSDDSISWQRFFDDAETMEFFPNPEGLTPEKRAHNWIERQLHRYKERKFGLQALMLKETEEFIGQCGLLTQDVDGKIELEVGYHIFREYRGCGYAPEAAKIFLDYALSNRFVSSVISIIHVKNLKSQRVAAKNGLIQTHRTTWMGKDVFIYRINS